MGIELNDEKREPPRTATRHLGFQIDLRHKVVSITQKHSAKILKFFKRFIICAKKNGRILVKNMQRMLGLQIWISTVFRIARQFLTSICDAIRALGPGQKYFYPRKNRALVIRILFDLKFWQRFVKSAPKTGFNYLLGRLPQNNCLLFSDAASLFGMGGVIMFGKEEKSKLGGIDGLFWQLTWHEWYEVVPMNCLKPGNVKINRAEFVAALITCETFASFSAG